MSEKPRFRPQLGERQDEYIARLIVETNSCYELTVLDRNSGVRLADYTVASSEYPAVGLLEVGRNTTESLVRDRKAYNHYSSDPYPTEELRSSWLLWCRPGTRFKPLCERALSILKELEAAGIDQMYDHDSWQAGSFSQRLHDIGVRSASSIPAGEPPARIFVSLAWGFAAATGPETVVDELEQWLAGDSTTDLREKLSADGSGERHAFVWVDANSAYGAWRALEDDALPARSPQLPSEVTHVWVTNGNAGWRWSPQGWSRLSCDAALALASQHWKYQI